MAQSIDAANDQRLMISGATTHVSLAYYPNPYSTAAETPMTDVPPVSTVEQAGSGWSVDSVVSDEAAAGSVA